ncbi:(2Fe-2S)-binding protein [Aquisphaera insulae]|uniref:(2Fe-2S)-binding protein n=1 Tax=Aquisphaera insulae TaxID=2712864 RepID=UPI002030A166|nr:(2Fe-2S)-binding protein [Aquisphaera insulae]
MASARRVTELKVNGTTRAIDADPEASLLNVLRDELDLTGTKYGCGEGKCGACTVLIDGQPAHSCRVRVGVASGRSITTIEGLAGPSGTLHPVQQAFLDLEAFQCAYCTSGMIMAAAGLLAAKPDPGEAEIVDAMQGNICRCGTHPRIVAAIRKAAVSMKEERR